MTATWITNFNSQELDRYCATVRYVGDPNLTVRENVTAGGSGRLPVSSTYVEPRNSLWYNGSRASPILSFADHVNDALRIKKYAPKSARFHICERYLIPALKCSVDMSGGHKLNVLEHMESEIIMNFPVAWLPMLRRLAEVMNEPGDGKDAFVLIEYGGYYNLCRQYGQETIARFPIASPDGCVTYPSTYWKALHCLDYLNRRNDYIAAIRPKGPKRWDKLTAVLSKFWVMYKTVHLIISPARVMRGYSLKHDCLTFTKNPYWARNSWKVAHGDE